MGGRSFTWPGLFERDAPLSVRAVALFVRDAPLSLRAGSLLERDAPLSARAGWFAGLLVLPPSRAVTTPRSLNAPGLGVAATGGLP